MYLGFSLSAKYHVVLYHVHLRSFGVCFIVEFVAICDELLFAVILSGGFFDRSVLS